MVSESRRRAASDDAKPDVSWKDASDSVQGSVMADNSTGNQSAYSLVPPLRVPAVKTSTQSAYAESIGLTDTVILREVVHVIDDFGLTEFAAVAATYGQDRFGYVVTPNVDHLIRYYEDAVFRAHYRAAEFILMDSRFAARLVYLLKGVRLPVCTGSDLTAHLLAQVIQPNDRIVMIGGDESQARQIAGRYGLHNLKHHNPPMGFIHDPAAVEACLDFIEQSGPFRFCFLAVGSPQQEVIAQALKARGIARGLALCIGASLNFITGHERRAPRWMQKLALEWLYRLLQNPRRLARRYLVRGPRIFGLLRRSRVVLRKASHQV
ncbi:MAG: WecB/TagA/CpsF family glycosyltransferase [Proteobacteria bacterium]|nr:WecB/TagA/CpsF family glycosyltransferase [Pseudomonadota bacterium]